MKSEICGCLYCLATFQPTEIKNWADTTQAEQTALCPKCSIDSVIGSTSGFPITQEFLSKMRKHWFGNL